jgi:hypothetical protein
MEPQTFSIMSLKSKLAQLFGIAMVNQALSNPVQYRSEMDPVPDPVDPDKVTGKLPAKLIPRGCHHFFFDINGNFSTERMKHEDIVFECIAVSDKSAVRKFSKWKEGRHD